MTQLTAHESRFSPRRSRRLPLRFLFAESIDGVLEEVDAHRASLSSCIPVQRRAVRDARSELTALAIELRSDTEVSARGLDLTKALLTDASGPLYTHSSPNALTDAVREARAALRTGPGR